MALRRRQGMSKSSTFMEETHPPPPEEGGAGMPPSSLVAQAIVASATHRPNSPYKDPSHKGAGHGHAYDREGSHESGSFWGVLARKAKAILDDDNNVPYQSEYVSHTRSVDHQASPTLRKGLNSVATNPNSIGNPLEDKTVDLMEETRKTLMRRKGNNEGVPSMQNTSQEDLLKASRDVAMATAAKAKLLLRELKNAKSDLAFAKERCSQLEEENKTLREGREKGVFPTDDDMIRLQLETLLAEKARLAHDNSAYARENRFLREIVEYHHLTMEDVVDLDDEGMEEITEMYPMALSRKYSASVSPPHSRRSSVSSSLSRSSSVAKEMQSLSAAFPRDDC